MPNLTFKGCVLFRVGSCYFRCKIWKPMYLMTSELCLVYWVFNQNCTIAPGALSLPHMLYELWPRIVLGGSRLVLRTCMFTRVTRRGGEQPGHIPLKHIPPPKNTSIMKVFSETLHNYLAHQFSYLPSTYILIATNLSANSLVDKRRNAHTRFKSLSNLSIQPPDDITFCYYVIMVSGMQEELRTFCIPNTRVQSALGPKMLSLRLRMNINKCIYLCLPVNVIAYEDWAQSRLYHLHGIYMKIAPEMHNCKWPCRTIYLRIAPHIILWQLSTTNWYIKPRAHNLLTNLLENMAAKYH